MSDNVTNSDRDAAKQVLEYRKFCPSCPEYARCHGNNCSCIVDIETIVARAMAPERARAARMEKALGILAEFENFARPDSPLLGVASIARGALE